LRSCAERLDSTGSLSPYTIGFLVAHRQRERDADADIVGARAIALASSSSAMVPLGRV